MSIRELLDKATPRPWRTGSVYDHGEHLLAVRNDGGPHAYICMLGAATDKPSEADAALIVYAVNLLEAHEAVAEAAQRLKLQADAAPIPLTSGTAMAWKELLGALARLDQADVHPQARSQQP